MRDVIGQDVSSLATHVPRLPGGDYIVTGATGVIGTYLVQTLVELARLGSDISSVHAVSYSPRIPPWASSGPWIHRHFGDVADPSFVESLPRASVVIHAAGYGQPGKFLTHPLATIAVNSTGTLRLLEKVVPGGQFLYLSTSEVYSGLERGPYRETQIGTSNTDHARAAYIEGKRVGEAAVSSFHHATQNPGASARLALAYGPGTRMGDSRVLNELIAQALTAGRIVLRDDGSARRTYCYVADAVQLLLSILASRQSGIFNVGGTSKTTILGLAEVIAGMTEARLDVPSATHWESLGAPLDVDLDLTKVLGLGSVPDWVELDEGLMRTLEWQRQNIFS